MKRLSIPALPCYKDREDLSSQERSLAQSLPVSEEICEKLARQVSALPKLILDESLLYTFVSFHAKEVIECAKNLGFKVGLLQSATGAYTLRFFSSTKKAFRYMFYVYSTTQKGSPYTYIGTVDEEHKDLIHFIKALLTLKKENDPRVLEALQQSKGNSAE